MTKKDGNYLCEDEYAYDVTLRLARNLLSHGAKVYVIVRDENDGIRDQEYLGYDKDEVVWFKQKIPINQVRRLKQRTRWSMNCTKRKSNCQVAKNDCHSCGFTDHMVRK